MTLPNSSGEIFKLDEQTCSSRVSLGISESTLPFHHFCEVFYVLDPDHLDGNRGT